MYRVIELEIILVTYNNIILLLSEIESSVFYIILIEIKNEFKDCLKTAYEEDIYF